MAPSQMEHQQEQTLGQGYTHKKFNCGYSHKKLGLRLRQRVRENKENISQPQIEQIKNNKHSKGLFRPYALDENNTPRKRKISRTSESSEENYTTPVSIPQTSPVTFNLQYQHLQNPVPETISRSCPASAAPKQKCESSALSPNSYAMRLQRQRAALYLRYMAQVHQTTAAINYPIGYPNVTAPIFNGC